MWHQKALLPMLRNHNTQECPPVITPESLLLNRFGHCFDSIPRETVGRKSTHILREIPTITDIQAIKPVITPNYQRLNDYWEQKHSKPKQKPNVIPLRRIPTEPKYNHNNTTSLPRIFASNVRSITVAKHAELLQLSADYDLMMITESWLKPHKLAAFNIPNFKLISVERASKKAGGVCIYVQENLTTSVVNKYTSDNVSALWIAVHNNNQPATIYGTLYHPPNLKKSICDQTIDYITSTISEISSKYKNSKFLLYGDFNDLTTTPISNVCNLTQIVWFPTREQNTLDLVFTDMPEYVSAPRTSCHPMPNVGKSDHSSIAISTNVKPKPKYETVYKRIVTEKSKISITNDLHEQSWDTIIRESDPHQKASLLQETVTAIVNKHCPVKAIRTPVGKAPISTPVITKLKNAKKKAFQRGCLSWKFFAGLLKIKLSEFQQHQADNNINNTITGSKMWWNNIKAITGERKTSNEASHVNIDDSWITAQDFCDKINEHYLSLGRDASFNIPEIPNTAAGSYTINEWEIHPLLCKINTKKSTHSSDFPSWVTKNNADILAKPIADIMTAILNSGAFPAVWKQAEVKPLPKTTNPASFKDFRPIALLFHLSKVAESCIKRELAKHTPSDINQYAYSKGLGTTDALVHMITDTAKHLDNKSTYGVQTLLIDFSKAFDLMRVDILTDKLLTMNVPESLIRLLISFLSDRKQRVRFQKCHSETLPTNLGVPQGTILGPSLWNVYVSDLQPSNDVIKYADDTTLYMPATSESVSVINSEGQNRVVGISDNPMQHAADNAVNWCEKANQRINATKTQYMLLTLQLNVSVTPPIMINGEQIQQTKTAKLLGVTIDDHPKFQSHVTTTIEKIRAATHGLLTLKRHGVNKTSLVKYMYYRSPIVPILTYAAPAWYSNTTQHSIDIVCVYALTTQTSALTVKG